MPTAKKSIPSAIKKKADELSRVVTIKEAKEVAAVKEAAAKLMERLGKLDKKIINGIPVRERYTLGLKDAKAGLAKVVKALDAGVKVK